MRNVPSDLVLKTDDAVIVEFLKSSGEQQDQSFGYIRHSQLNDDGSVDFTMIVPWAYAYWMKPHAKIKITDHCNRSKIRIFVDAHTDICNVAETSKLLDGIVNPSLFSPIDQQVHICIF